MSEGTGMREKSGKYLDLIESRNYTSSADFFGIAEEHFG
jgi:hypothetical protein